MRNQGLGPWPARRARMSPAATALSWAEGSMSYRELAQRSTRAAWLLRECGVRAGDRVGYLGPNHPAYLEVLFAAGVLGAVFVPLNFRLAAAELDSVLVDAGVAALVHTADYDAVAAARPALRAVRIGPEYEHGLAQVSAAPIDEPVGLDDPCLIMYTSGSSGRPKGVVLTHGNLTWNCVNVLVDTDVGAEEVALVCAPLFHAAALGMICLPTLLKGGQAVLVSKFDPGLVLDLIEQRRVTWIFGVPTMFDALSAHDRWDSTDLSSLRILMCGGAPVPHNTIRRYLDRGLNFIQGYGMTETAPGALLLDRAHTATKIGSAGVPSFFTDVRVVDEHMDTVAPGVRGEVVVSGPNVMPGYWGRPGETAHALREGWFHSGDVATVDEDGYVYIVDRVKDVIISGGENIYPAEVENVLREHPQVAACAVIGVADPRWGEVGKAIVVAAAGHRPDPGALLGFLRERLAAYKVPHHVEFVDSLPVTGSGKVRKSELRQRYGH